MPVHQNQNHPDKSDAVSTCPPYNLRNVWALRLHQRVHENSGHIRCGWKINSVLIQMILVWFCAGTSTPRGHLCEKRKADIIRAVGVVVVTLELLLPFEHQHKTLSPLSESTDKGVNQHVKDVTQTQQQGPESPTVRYMKCRRGLGSLLLCFARHTSSANLTPSQPWCHLKTTNKKSEILNP